MTFNCPNGLLTNPEFESDFVGWSFYNNSNTVTDAYSGSKAAQTSGSAAGGVGQNMPAFAGQVYSLEVYAKQNASGGAVVGIQYFDNSWTELSGAYQEITSSTFQSYTISAKAPEGTAYVQAMGWKNAGTGTATFDAFCFEEWDVDVPVCSDVKCEISPSWGNYVWAMTDGGEWKDYDDGGLYLCANGDGSLSILGNIINAHDSHWDPGTAVMCGAQDGWELDLTLTDPQTWTEFQGTWKQDNGCGDNHVDWDYWDVSGVLTGTGCNTGRTIYINSAAAGYRMQVGWGGNSQSCDFGMSTWFQATENGAPVNADIYIHVDANCYFDTRPEECLDGVDNDLDGLIDCYDGDCGPEMLQNTSFEDVTGVNFNTTFEGNPAVALENGSNLLPDWQMAYACGGFCYDSYLIDDTQDLVNNPKGDYFLWFPGSSYCARQSLSLTANKCYEMTMTVAAWSVPSPQLSTNVKLEMFGGGVDNGNGGLLTIYEEEIPASPNWQNLNWRTLKFTYTATSTTTTSLYISQDNASTIARGIVFDEISVKEVCCSPTGTEICGNGIDDDGDGYVDNGDQDCLCPTIYTPQSQDTTICEGAPITFQVHSNAPNPPYSYLEFYRFDSPQANPYTSSDAKVWLGEFENNFNGTGSITSSNFPNALSANETYYVYGCVKPAPQDPTTCFPLVEYEITVKAGATADAGNDATICAGVSHNLLGVATGGVGPYTYTWDNGLGTGANKTVNPLSTTNYNLTVTGGNGCSSTDQVTISVNPSPTVDAGSDVSICISDATTLSATGSGAVAPSTFQWSQGLGTGDTKVVSPSTTTTYGVTLTSGNGCNAVDNVTVTVSNCVEDCTDGIDNDLDGLIDCEDDDCQPDAYAGTDISICTGTSATIEASVLNGNGTYVYTWDNGLGGGATQIVSPTSTTTYTVTITNAAGCEGTAQVTVTVNFCPEDCTDGIDNDGDGLVDCDDPDCLATAAPQPVDDDFTTCPAIPLTDRVTYNDGNLQDPSFTIVTYPSNGTVVIDGTGKFTYTPFTATCGTDIFVYEVCNQAIGCCDVATVNITVGDTDSPVLLNLPADVTISCDEVVPDPTQVLAYDECPGIYIDFEEVTQEHAVGACETYTITRTWQAEDLCGNTSSGQQVITVEDLEAPELFRVYTLANGKRVVAGVSKRASHNWKYQKFPITFDNEPLVFSQVITNNEASAVVVQQRYTSTQGFELKLAEQEASDLKHAIEQVAWLAIEPGAVPGMMDVGAIANAYDMSQTLTFGQTFSAAPLLIAATQTANETDPVGIRLENGSASSFDVFLQEETSKDGETWHSPEELAYLAIEPNAAFEDEDGFQFGETGFLNLTNAWATVSLTTDYVKPVIILGGVTGTDGSPVTIRVRNVSNNSFEVRLQEWDAQDGAHGLETVSFIVVEGSLPASYTNYCDPEGLDLNLGTNIFISDNCDDQISIDFTETSTLLANGLETTRTWLGMDDCGNPVVYSRTDNCTVAALRLKSFLQGATVDNPASTLMSDKLRFLGFLPTTEPYTGLSGFAHHGKGGGETVSPTRFDQTGDDAVVDWMFVEVRNMLDPDEILATRSVLIQRDGDIETHNGGDVVYFPELLEGQYFVTLRHRNHLGMTTEKAWTLSSVNIPTIDFGDLTVDVKGNVTGGAISGSKRTMWAGDFNGDRKVIYQGPSNDVFFLFSRVLSDNGNANYLANFIAKGYDRNDFNMDGNIIYQGPANDRSKVLFHTILSHPSNSSFLANYIVSEKLP